MHRTNRLDWNVLDHSAVGEQAPLVLNRSKHAGNRHGSAYGLSQRTIFEHDNISTLHIRGHATKGNGQVVKTGDTGLRKSKPTEQKSDALARVVSVGTADAMLQA